MSITGKIGKLRHQIEIQERTLTPDNCGGFTESWAAHATVFASIEPISAREMFWSKRLQSDVSHKITIRSLSTVTADMRVQFESRIFKILGVMNLEERPIRTELLCLEGAGS